VMAVSLNNVMVRQDLAGSIWAADWAYYVMRSWFWPLHSVLTNTRLSSCIVTNCMNCYSATLAGHAIF